MKILCAFGCGRSAKKGRRLCVEHLEHQRLKMAAFRVERKKKGLCSRCSNKARRLPNGKASTICDVCRARTRKLEAKNKLKRIKLKNT